MSPEDGMQIALVNYIRLQYPKAIFCHIPNGGNRNPREGAKFKRMGVLPGMPDLMFFNPISNDSGIVYCGLALELKTQKGKLRPNQQDRLSELKQCDWHCKVAYGFDQAKEIVDNYLMNLNV